LTSQKAQSHLNELGASGTPFLAIIDFEMEQPLVFPLSRIPADIHFQIGGLPKGTALDSEDLAPAPFDKNAIKMEQYAIEYGKVQESIQNGDTYLLNLTNKCKISTSFSLKQIYHASKAKYKLLYKDQFVVFSPECFVKMENGIISSYPMKGTIDASIPNAENILLSDAKEKAEHATIVDLIRNDLSRVSDNVHVKRYRYLDYLATNDKNIYQMSSEVEGILSDNYRDHLGDILFSLLPAGSISGAPKNKTIEIIKNTEAQKRGYYTGVMVHFDGANLDSGVLIRFIEKDGDHLFFRSGGGITYQSSMEREYQELMDKIYVPVA